jgi:hypothetical protein
MTDPSMMSLDELFAEARQAAKAERTLAFKRKAKDPVEPAAIPQTLYTDPENWTRTRGLALIHAESKALLGNFWEWRHKSVKDARRLVRSAEPIPVVGAEEIDINFAGAVPPPRGERVETTRIIRLDLVLEAPAVRAAAVLVCVHYYDGWTAKVVLVEDTTLAEGEEILLLPGGVDVLPALGREMKVQLRNVK